MSNVAGDQTSDPNPVRFAKGVQHMLPIALMLVALLELMALLPVPLDSLALGGVAAMLGPGSFLAMVIAVLWAAFLPPSRSALLVKAATAVGSVAVVVTKLVLVLLWWTGHSGGGPVGWSAVLLVLTGLVLGVVMLVWSVVDLSATRSVLAQQTSSGIPAQSASAAPSDPPVRSATPARPPSPVTTVSASTPTRQSSPESAPEQQIRHPRPQAPSSQWRSVSTPWPRRDEADPDGTIIRSPRRGRRRQ